MMLLGAFGAVALALALVGVYGVVSYIVAQRTREIGIRIALGAQRGQVLRLVLAGAMRPVLAGLAVGAVGAMFAARLLGTLLLCREAWRSGRPRGDRLAPRRRGGRRVARAWRAGHAGRSGDRPQGRMTPRQESIGCPRLATATSAGRRTSSPMR